jgi:DNA-directed RNA polymerase specialized sigma24 family protein
MKIAEHLSYNHMFVKYSYREDMIGDSIENAIRYMDSYDPEKYSNPFAYFTEVMKNAFWRRRAREEKQSYIKKKLIESSGDFFSTQKGDKGKYENSVIEFARENGNDIVANFEDKKRAKKEKAKTRIKKAKKEVPNLEKFLVSLEQEEDAKEN